MSSDSCRARMPASQPGLNIPPHVFRGTCCLLGSPAMVLAPLPALTVPPQPCHPIIHPSSPCPNALPPHLVSPAARFSIPAVFSARNSLNLHLILTKAHPKPSLHPASLSILHHLILPLTPSPANKTGGFMMFYELLGNFAGVQAGASCSPCHRHDPPVAAGSVGVKGPCRIQMDSFT